MLVEAVNRLSPNVKDGSMAGHLFCLDLTDKEGVRRMTREEIELRRDELARKYLETDDKKIIKQLYELDELARELRKLEKKRFSD